jgi:signal peptidase II
MRYLIISALIIFGDQCLKKWVAANVAVGEQQVLIPGLIRLTHIDNIGAAFSILEGKRIMFLILTAIVCVVILVLLITGKISGRLGQISASMLLGGAIGNAIDRAVSGYVVDMFEFTFVNFAIFNIADIFITSGGTLFCLHIILLEYRDKHKRAGIVPQPDNNERS